MTLAATASNAGIYFPDIQQKHSNRQYANVRRLSKRDTKILEAVNAEYFETSERELQDQILENLIPKTFSPAISKFVAVKEPVQDEVNNAEGTTSEALAYFTSAISFVASFICIAVFAWFASLGWSAYLVPVGIAIFGFSAYGILSFVLELKISRQRR